MKDLFNLWQSITPKTKMTFVIVLGVVLITLIITAGVTGNLDELIVLIGGGD